MSLKKISGTILLYGFLLSIALICLVPMILVVSSSLTENNTLTLDGYRLIPGKLSLSAYTYIFRDAAQLYTSYKVTIIVTAAGTLCSLLLTSLLAYPLSRSDFAYKYPLSFYIFFTMLFNGGLVPFYILVAQYLHMRDSIWALIVPGLISPFFVILMRTFFSTIPASIIESAMIEGAGEFRVFGQIVLPLTGPILATVGLFTTLNYWNDWFNSLLFIDNRNLISLQYLLVMMMQNIDFMLSNPNSSVGSVNIPAEPARMAMAVLAIGPIAFVYLFFQKFLVRGIIIGAVKG